MSRKLGKVYITAPGMEMIMACPPSEGCYFQKTAIGWICCKCGAAK